MENQITGSSQDEIVLIQAFTDARIGKLRNRDQDTYSIEIFGQIENYKLFKTIEFTSDRKMMSVVMKNIETE